MSKDKKKNAHYIDNAKFLEAMKEWKQSCEEAEEAGEERPQVTNYIGECFLRLQMVYLIDLTLSTIPIVQKWYLMA